MVLLLLKVMVVVVVVMVAWSLPVPSRIIDPEQRLVDGDTAHLGQLGRVTQAQHRPQICLGCHKPVPGPKVQIVLLRVEEGLPRLPGYAKRSPVLSESFTAGFMANMKVRWNLGLRGAPKGGGRGGERAAAIQPRSQRFRATMNGYEPWAWQVEGPYFPSKLGWEFGK